MARRSCGAVPTSRRRVVVDRGGGRRRGYCRSRIMKPRARRSPDIRAMNSRPSPNSRSAARDGADHRLVYRDADVDFGAAYRAVRPRCSMPLPVTTAFPFSTRSTRWARCPRHHRRGLEHHARNAEPASPAGRSHAVRHGEPERDLRRHRRAPRFDQGHTHQANTAALIAMPSWVIRGDRVVLPGDGTRHDLRGRKAITAIVYGDRSRKALAADSASPAHT